LQKYGIRKFIGKHINPGLFAAGQYSRWAKQLNITVWFAAEYLPRQRPLSAVFGSNKENLAAQG